MRSVFFTVASAGVLTALSMLSGGAAVAATGNAGNAAQQLSDAVASVNDWRALGIFLMFFVVLDRVWNSVERSRDRQASKSLIEANDRLTAQIAEATLSTIKHQARMEALLPRLEEQLNRLEQGGEAHASSSR